ncbi:MAG: homogentisate 1,2-dioxygenase, partial [Bacteroidetes bacterium]|nr:homogentisate 1,2-dioxygenase [Bacteroidota bacterium]
MPHYQVRGQIPAKRHTVFRKPDESLYAEELVSSEGFSDIYSIIYHEFPPTQVIGIDLPIEVSPEIAIDKNMQHRSFKGFDLPEEDDYLKSRQVVLFNQDVQIILAAPKKSMGDWFFKNAQADEMIFVHKGSGILDTIYGELPFHEGDHVIIPRGTIYQLTFAHEHNRLFIVESMSPLNFPKRYLNKSGQLLEHSPFHERDIRTPEKLVTHHQTGDFKVIIKQQQQLFPYHY